jgi:hypothetical protein
MHTRPFLTISLAILLALPAGVWEASAQPIPGRGPNGQSNGGAYPTGDTAEGRIVGQVLESETLRPLPGAQIQVLGTSMGSLAGIEGRYQIRPVPAGSVDIRVTMLGFAPKTVTGVEVPEGQGVRLDILLEMSALELEGITVTASQARGSQVMALADQRSAVGVQSAITSEQMSRSPDGDAAAAIKRVSGVSVQDGKFVFVRGLGERYTTASLNGNRIPSPEPERKVVPLDLFPSSVIQTITASKTFTPADAGDFSGAAVNIRTREFPTRRQLSLSASTGYHPDIVGKTILRAPTADREWLGFGTIPRTLPHAARNMPPDARRGPQVNQIVNSFRNVWSVRSGEGQLPMSVAASLGGQDPLPLLGQEVGYLLSATYSLSDEVELDQRRARAGAQGSVYDAYEGEAGTQSVLWGGIANFSTMLGTHTRISLDNTYNRSADNQARRETGTDENTRAHVMVDRLTYVERTVRSSQLRAEHQLHPNHRLDWSLSSSAVTRSEPDRSEFVTWLDPDVPVWFNDFEGAVRSFGDLEESSLEGSADYQLGFRLGGRSHLFRAGGRYRETTRDASSQGFRIQAFFWAPDDPRWQLSPEEFFDGRFATDADANFLLSRELAGGSYDARDELTAGYGMVDLGLASWLRLVGGARVEQYRLTVDSQNSVGQASVAERNYTDVLPALALNFDIGGEHKLRLSATRTLARPEYRELAPITYREVLGGEQVMGNGDIERTLIDNYDIRWEWYPGLAEVVSVGLFGKRFQNPIEQRFLARSGTDTRTFENAESAENYGVEVEVMKNLAFVAAALEPLSLFANVTFMESVVNTGNPEDLARRMVGQAPWVLNTGLTYASSSRRTSATAFYNVVGPRIVNARASGTKVDDVVETARHLVDVSFRFPFRGNTWGKIDLKNLLDSPYEIVQGDITRNYHRTGRSISFGVSRQF